MYPSPSLETAAGGRHLTTFGQAPTPTASLTQSDDDQSIFDVEAFLSSLDAQGPENVIPDSQDSFHPAHWLPTSPESFSFSPSALFHADLFDPVLQPVDSVPPSSCTLHTGLDLGSVSSAFSQHYPSPPDLSLAGLVAPSPSYVGSTPASPPSAGKAPSSSSSKRKKAPVAAAAEADRGSSMTDEKKAETRRRNTASQARCRQRNKESVQAIQASAKDLQTRCDIAEKEAQTLRSENSLLYQALLSQNNTPR